MAQRPTADSRPWCLQAGMRRLQFVFSKQRRNTFIIIHNVDRNIYSTVLEMFILADEQVGWTTDKSVKSNRPVIIFE